MAGFTISDAEKAVYTSAIQDIHLAFCRPIVAFKTAEKVVISTNPDVNYNDFYQTSNDDAEEFTYVPVSGTFQARILYDKALEHFFATPRGSQDESVRMNLDGGLVRLKVEQDAWDFLKDAINVNFDGYNFERFRTERPHGLFTPQYYTIYLTFKN